MNKNELLKVMIVDDEEMIRRGLRAIVDWKEYGYTVCCDAADGEDGYQKALVYQPDLIITDIKMPIADGLQMMTKLRENCFETEFILLTGYAEFEYAQKALQLGAKSYILKPIDEEELVKTLIEAREEILQRRKENFHNKYFSISMEQVITKLVYGAVDEEFIDAANAVYGFQLPWKRYQLVLLEQTKKAGQILAIASVVIILLFTKRGEKNPFKRIIGGLSALYGISGWVSDLLSYMRLFGMGLATGVIGMVFNQLIGMIWDAGIIGKIIGAVLFVGCHAFNLGINALGAYVHSCRLQYIEFFGKFYEDGGRPFAPLGVKPKYVSIQPGEAEK